MKKFKLICRVILVIITLPILILLTFWGSLVFPIFWIPLFSSFLYPLYWLKDDTYNMNECKEGFKLFFQFLFWAIPECRKFINE